MRLFKYVCLSVFMIIAATALKAGEASGGREVQGGRVVVKDDLKYYCDKDEYCFELREVPLEMIESELSEEAVVDVDLIPEADKSDEGFPPNSARRLRGFKKVLIGPTYKSSGLFSSYDYWRYVTSFNVTSKKEQMHSLPVVFEECYDDSDNFVTYSQSTRFGGRFESSFKIFELGIRTTLFAEREVAISRSLKATLGLEAEHVPYVYSKNWTGKIAMQTYNQATGKIKWFTVKDPDFSLSGVSPVLRVKREIVRECDESEYKQD